MVGVSTTAPLCTGDSGCGAGYPASLDFNTWSRRHVCDPSVPYSAQRCPRAAKLHPPHAHGANSGVPGCGCSHSPAAPSGQNLL
jgi:hypothetical protein